MTVQTVPYALQNASHSAALFRQSASAPFLIGGALSSLELLVTQQGSPNMSVILGAGRAKVVGTAVSPPAGQSWTTQAMYDCLNDAPLTLTIAASNPTNPRIDVVYIQVQDSFYSGATNQAIAGVVTGTPAPSPSVPAVPANATAIATIAVGAGVTSIVNANIARVVSSAVLIGGLYPTATATTLAALQTAAALPTPSRVTVLSNGSEWYWNGSIFTLDNTPRVASAAARDALYVAPVAVQTGDTVYRTDTKMEQTYNGTVWRYTTAGMVPVIPTSVTNGTIGAGGAVAFSTVTSLTINGCFTTEFDDYFIEIDVSTASGTFLGVLQVRSSGTTETGAVYTYFEYTGSAGGQNFATSATATSYESLRADNPGGGHSDIWVHSPMLAAYTGIFDASWSAVASRDSKATVKTTTAYDGWVLSTVAGTVTVTGTVRIYGYNKN